MNPMQRKVADWHERFGVPVARKPTTIPLQRCDLRARLIREELDELEAYLLTGNLIEIADALADLLYVTFGTAVELGMDMEPIFNEVQRSNLSKLWPDGKPRYREDGKVLKPPNYSPPNLAPILEEQSK